MGIASSQTKKYQVFSALITQSGTGNQVIEVNSGYLIIGTTYKITDLQTGDDFTNVGSANNEIDEIFIATGTTPREWGGGSSLEYDTSAPTLTILENTFKPVFGFVWKDVGSYQLESSIDVFDTVVLICSPFGMFANDKLYTLEIKSYEPKNIRLDSRMAAIGPPSDNVLSNTFIEIRNYKK